MQRKSKPGEMAYRYHKSGYHCAEAVSKAIIEAYDSDIGEYTPKAATAFGGGVGRTKQEICGALSGGIIAIGYLFGRREPEADWTDASNLAAKLKLRFVHEYGATNCGALLATFGPQENMLRCKKLSGEVADMLVDIIEEHRKA
ncbi:MAG: C-GCAxxG-C-C family protein [Desulfobacterales bacterium]|nr:MAG: C-GCAxxG-C-C family protein [Desulfobacterales bacterium]